MKPEQFTSGVAKRVMLLWKEHLGFFYRDHHYYTDAKLLVYALENPQSWLAGRFEDRIGSRYTDDSKLLAYLRSGQLEFECYAQAQTVMGPEKRKEAENAEDAFNKAVHEYIQTVL